MTSGERGKTQKQSGPVERALSAVKIFSFTDPAMEKQFQRRQHKENLLFNRWVAIVGFVAYSGYFFINYIIIPPGNVLLYLIPYLVSIPAFILFISITFMDLTHHEYNRLAVACMLFVNTAPMVSLLAYIYPNTLYFRFGCILLVLTGFIFIRLSFYYITGFAALYLLIFELLFLCPRSVPTVEAVNINILLLLAIGVGLVVNYTIEKRERTNFVKLRIIVEQRMKLSLLKDARPGSGRKAR
ncbi:MAG: hypothetical protein JXA07_06185 [Spirochaetes bacterium]|nr:hypothetical protein [Spirochaetota bacterium]